MRLGLPSGGLRKSSTPIRGGMPPRYGIGVELMRSLEVVQICSLSLQFQRILKAYEVLSDPMKVSRNFPCGCRLFKTAVCLTRCVEWMQRQQYDNFGYEPSSDFGGAMSSRLEKLMEELRTATGCGAAESGQWGSGSLQSPLLQVNLQLSLEEVMSGCHKTVQFKRGVVCTSCSDLAPCSACNGTGSTSKQFSIGGVATQSQVECMCHCHTLHVVFDCSNLNETLCNSW